MNTVHKLLQTTLLCGSLSISVCFLCLLVLLIARSVAGRSIRFVFYTMISFGLKSE